MWVSTLRYHVSTLPLCGISNRWREDEQTRHTKQRSSKSNLISETRQMLSYGVDLGLSSRNHPSLFLYMFMHTLICNDCPKVSGTPSSTQFDNIRWSCATTELPETTPFRVTWFIRTQRLRSPSSATPPVSGGILSITRPPRRCGYLKSWTPSPKRTGRLRSVCLP